MAPRTALSAPLRAWKCPSCRSVSYSPKRQATGPESPRFISVPEPPQSTIPDRPPVKGILPVPRDIFGGPRGINRASEERIRRATPLPQKPRQAQKGSREEWKHKLAEQRRLNLREGLKALEARKRSIDAGLTQRGLQRQMDREALVRAPEREDERLTAPSHGLNLQKLYDTKIGLPDPTRETRLQAKREAYDAHVQLKKDARMEHLHDLYTNARHFIVNTQQLERAVDEAFGTPAQPVTFVSAQRSSRSGFAAMGGKSGGENSHSVWALGPPARVQDMANSAAGGKGNISGAGSTYSNTGYAGVNKERMRRIGEAFTGGKMVNPDDEAEMRRQQQK